MKKLYLLLLVALCGAMISPAVAKKKNKKKASTEATTKKEKKETKYDKLFKDKKVTTAKGFITLHKLDNKIYFELPIKVMNRDILLGSTIVETTDNQFGCVGEKSGDPFLIRFVQRDSTITLRRVQAGQFSEDREIKKRLVSSTMPAIAETFEIKAYNNDSTAVVFDMTDYLLSDKKNLSPFSPYSMMEMMGADISKDFEKESSFIQGVKGFEDNVSIRSLLTYKISVGMKGNYAVKKMPFTAVMNRSFILLPEQPMRPRYADPRIGIFEHSVVEFASEGRGLRTRHIAHRWNLEPSDSAAYLRGELVEPKKPIVFYIDDTFPLSWNKYIHKGVEVWQKAFEKIGFKNAIIAKDFPKDDPDFDPDNLKYSTIRYVPTGVVTTMKDASFADPRTGEIMNASLYLYHDLLKWNNIQRFVQTSQVDPDARHLRLPDDLMSETLRCAVRREVGFALGLIENMAGSFAIPTDSLRSASYTQKYGITASVMDEVGFNYVAQPSDKGVMLSPKLGVYDYYAIKVAYKPILEAQTAQEENKVVRQWISEKSGDPMYRFGTKQYLLTTFDPSALSFDLGNDAIKASTYGINNLRYIVAHMHEWMDAEDKNYDYRNMVFPFIVQQLRGYLFNVYRNIGSFYLNEHFVGDANATLTAVPKDLQRASLDFLFTQLKDLEWIDDEDVIKKLSFSGSQARKILKNYVVKEKNVITDLYQTKRVSLTYYRDPSSYSPKEYIDDLYELVWRPTMEGRSLTEPERIMQAEFLSNVRNSVDINGQKRWFGQYYLSDDNTDKVGALDEEEDEEAESAIEEQGYGSRAVMYNIATDNQNHLWYGTYQKLAELVKKQQMTGDEQTRAHYKYLLFLMTRSWKDAPKI